MRGERLEARVQKDINTGIDVKGKKMRVVQKPPYTMRARYHGTRPRRAKRR